MRNLTVLRSLLFTCFFLAGLPLAYATESQSFGDYTIDYTTFPSTLLDPEIATQYGIKRSQYETLINVFVSKKGKTGGVDVIMNGTATNLMAQQQVLKFLEIKEENTVYYIAPIRVTNEDLLHIKINCSLPDNSEEFEVKFSKTFYKD